MLDLHTAQRKAADRERAAKSASPRPTVLAEGARSQEEHLILTALRSAPSTSVSDLRSRVEINNNLAFTFAYNALRDAGKIREAAVGYFGVMRIEAVEPGN